MASYSEIREIYRKHNLGNKMENNEAIHPNCCKQALHAVFLRHHNDDIYGKDFNGEVPETGQKGVKPKWFVLSYDYARGCSFKVEVSFCPHCGKKLPDLKERENPPDKICQVTDGGYYCDVCNKRLSECRCLPPEHAWEVYEESPAKEVATVKNKDSFYPKQTSNRTV